MKALVLIVDRDNDVGRLLGVEGPVIGPDDVLKIGIKLLKKDANETDGNAIFRGLSIFDSLNVDEKEIAIVTGSVNVGTESDMKIASQLEKIFQKFKADAIIFVSDGPEDEGAIPVVESFAKVIAVERVSVKSPLLKSMGYSLLSYLSKIKESKTLRRIFLLIPGIFLVVYGIFGDMSWRLIAGFLGLYFLYEAGKREIESGGKTLLKILKNPHILFSFTILVVSLIKVIYEGINYYGNFLQKILYVFSTQEVFLYLLIISVFIGVNAVKRMGKKEAILNLIIFLLFVRTASEISRWAIGYTSELVPAIITFAILLLVITGKSLF